MKKVKNLIHKYHGYTIKYCEQSAVYKIYDCYDSIIFMTTTLAAARSYIDLYLLDEKKNNVVESDYDKKYWWQEGQYE